MKPPDRAPGLPSRRLSTLVPDGVSSLLNSKRATTRHRSSWRYSQDSSTMQNVLFFFFFSFFLSFFHLATNLSSI